MSTFENKIQPNLKKIDSFVELNPEDLVACAEEEGRKIKEVEDLKKHQLRRFYNAVKQIERKTFGKTELSDDVLADLAFLRPHLANAARKEGSFKRLQEVLDECLVSNTIKQPEDLTRFVKFFESIVVYAS